MEIEEMEIAENGNCGKWKLWKIEIMENGNCGKWKLWNMEIVEILVTCYLLLVTRYMFFLTFYK